VRFETRAGTFEALEAGARDAPLVLCLHGFPDHPPSFVPLCDRLARAGYRAVAPWMRGYAPSVAEGPYGVDTLASDAIAIADALSPGAPVALVGHDWGAVATYAAAASHPERLFAAVAMAVPHPLAFVRNAARQPEQLVRSWYMAFFQLRGLADRVVAARDFAFIEHLWRRWSPGYLADPAAMRALKACLSDSMPAPLAYYRAMAWPPRKALARLRGPSASARSIRVPTMHLCGLDDGCIAPDATRGQERFFSGPFQSEQITGVGHFLQLEAPDRVATLVLDWLSQHGGRPVPHPTDPANLSGRGQPT